MFQRLRGLFRPNASMNASSPLPLINGDRHALIRKGDSFIDKDQMYDYRLIRLIGSGGYSQVWLAFNHKLEKYVALKILSENSTVGLYSNQLGEFDALRIIFRGAVPPHRSNRERSFNPDTTLRSRFLCSALGFCFPHIDSTTGSEHHVFEFELLNPTLQHVLDTQKDVLTRNIVRRYVAMILSALDYIHVECGLFHTDLRPVNLSLRPDESITTEHIDEILGSIAEGEEFTLPFVPEEAVAVLCDFGTANFVDHIYHQETGSHNIQPPEVILSLGPPHYGPPVDIWAMGLLVFNLLTGQPLFWHQQPNQSAEDYRAERISRMRLYTEQLFPSFMCESFEGRKLLQPNGLPRRMVPFNETLSSALSNYNPLEPHELAQTVAFIQRCLTLDPSRRPSAKELLSDPWLEGAWRPKRLSRDT